MLERTFFVGEFCNAVGVMHKCTFTPRELQSISIVDGRLSLIWSLTLDLASFDIITDSLGAPSINLATSAESSSENLENSSLELLSQRLLPHLAGNLDDLIKRNGLGVLDVLLLLAVSGRLLQGLDDEGGSRGNNRDGGLTVLDGETDGNTETFLQQKSDI